MATVLQSVALAAASVCAPPAAVRDLLLTPWPVNCRGMAYIAGCTRSCELSACRVLEYPRVRERGCLANRTRQRRLLRSLKQPCTHALPVRVRTAHTHSCSLLT